MGNLWVHIDLINYRAVLNVCNRKLSLKTYFFQEQRASATSPKPSDPAKDYSDGANHVLSVIHNILAQHRSLESRWHAKKIKLHQRLALRLFQEDVKQVLDWLQNHGEVFLRKNIGIGRNIGKKKNVNITYQI